MEEMGLPPKKKAAEEPAQPAQASLSPRLHVEEGPPRELALPYDESLQGAGGHPDSDELWHPSLFWSPPPVRLFVFRGVA